MKPGLWSDEAFLGCLSTDTKFYTWTLDSFPYIASNLAALRMKICCCQFARAYGSGIGSREEMDSTRHPPFGSLICYQRARMRYLRTEVPSLATGTLNCAANAAVFVYLWVEESISQSPPMGSFT